MISYKLNIPTRIYFGRDILRESLESEKDFICANVLIVTTGRSLYKFGHVQKLLDLLKQNPNITSITVFDKISANPLVQEVDLGISCGIQNKASMVIGFGGGSALDAAKAVAAGIGMHTACRLLYANNIEPSKSTLPIIAIPTTAGTGSELSKAAIISDDVNKTKKGIRGKHLFPAVAIVDSIFTETIPFEVTMQTGFDVFAHATESYLSRLASPYTKMLSEYAIKAVGKSLITLTQDIGNNEARSEMSYASMLMGINLGNASTCLPHRLQYPLGAHTNTSHGAGLASLYLAWLYYEADVSLEPLCFVMDLLGYKNCKTREDVVAVMGDFLDKLKLPHSLKDLGVQESYLDVFTKEVSGNIANDPASVVEDVISKIYHRAF